MEPLILTTSRQPAEASAHADVLPTTSPTPVGVTLPWHRSAVLLSASGLSLYEVSRSLNRPVREIQSYLSTPEARTHLAEINTERVAGTYENAQLHAAASDAVLVLQTLMHTAASENVRLAAATQILDRTLGRPSQTIVHSSKPKQSEDEEIERLRKELGMK